MAGANTLDFLGEGTVDQGTAAGLSEEEKRRLEEDARMRQYEARKQARLPYQNSYSQTRGAANQAATDLSNRAVTAERIARTGSARGNRQGLWDNLMDDPVTLGILAAPYGVVGAGLAMGGPQALGFGMGEGSLVGGSSPAYAFKDVVAPTLSRTPTAMPGGIGVPGTAAHSAGAATAGGSAAGGGAAAGTGGLTASGFATKYGVPIGLGLLPMALQKLNGGETKEQQALVAKQEQMAREVQQRRGQMQDARMDALGQQVLAFNPRNQMMAQMFGPDAAFSPQQMAAMSVNPIKPQLPADLRDYRGTDPKKEAEIAEFMRRQDEYNAAEARRQAMVMGGIQQPGAGPAPIQQRMPLPARRV